MDIVDEKLAQINAVKNINHGQKVIAYTDTAKGVSDAKAIETAIQILDSDYLETCNSTVVDVVRILIQKGFLNYEKVVFKYNENDIIPDKYGQPDEWPDGFCDLEDRLISILLFGKSS